VTRHVAPLALTAQAAPVSPSSGRTAVYVESTYGQVQTKTSAGVVRNLSFENVYNVKDYGATGDGSTDDAAAIQAALDLASSTNPGSVLFIPAGTYKVSSELEIKGSVWIQAAPGATIRRGSSSMQYLIKNFNASYGPTLYGGRGGIRITGGIWDGDGGNLTGNITVIIVAHAKGVIIEGATVRNVRDWHGIELNSSQDVTVRNCTIEGFNPFTTTRWYSEAIQIDLAINSAALPGIGATSYDNTPCDNVTIDNVTVRGYGTLGSFGCLTGSHSWADGHKMTRIKVVNCFADSLNDYMVNATNWDDLIVANNICQNSNSFVAFQLPTSGMTDDMYRCVIANNSIYNTGVINAASAVNAAAILIQGNDVSGAGNVVREVTISNNVFHTVGNSSTAITAVNVADLVINGGSMKNMVANGISVKGCRTAVVNGVKVAGASTKSIVIWDGTTINSAGTTVTNCVIDNAGDHAIDISSQGCTVSDCVLQEQVTSGKSLLRVNATDVIVAGNNFWRRGGSTSSNGIQVESSATSCYFSGNRLKGWATNTSTAASAVTGTAVWAISGVVLDPAIASFTTSSANKINATN
jgi:hypothetical protein